MRYLFLFSLALLLSAPNAQAQPDGAWTGSFALPGIPGGSAIALSDGRLYVGTAAQYAGTAGPADLVYYDFAEATWGTLDPPRGAGKIGALAVGPAGHLYVTDVFRAGGGATTYLSRYDPATETWDLLEGAIDGAVFTLALGPDDAVYAGGAFESAGGVPALNIARYDLSAGAWSALGSGADEWVRALAADEEYLYVGGSFSEIGGVAATGVARYDPAAEAWSGLGGGVGPLRRVGPLALGGVTSFAFGGDGVYVGGEFDYAYQPDGDSLLVHNAARWDGEQWSAVVEDGTEHVESVGFDTDGSFYALGVAEEGGLLYWDGLTWSDVDTSPLGVYLGNQQFVAEVLADAGRLYIMLSSEIIPDAYNPNNGLYWYEPEGEQWGVLGNEATNGMTDDVWALAAGPGGEVYAGGLFPFAGTEQVNLVARWDGAAWAALGQGVAGRSDAFSLTAVQALRLARDGTLYVGGNFREARQADGTTVAAGSIAQWDSKAGRWNALGGGTSGFVGALAEGNDGSLYVAGAFARVYQENGDSLEVGGLAQWDPALRTWKAVPEGDGLNRIHALALDATGALYVGGYRFISQTGEFRASVARLDPLTEQWTILQEWEFTEVLALTVIGDPTSGGVLYAGVPAEGVWRWEGGAWTDLDGPRYPRALALNGDPRSGGELYGGGAFPGPYVERWNGTRWNRMGSGVEGLVYALAVGASATEGQAEVWVGGELVTAGGAPASCIARWETQDFSTAVEDHELASVGLGLAAFPNPSSGAVTLRYRLAAPGAVRLAVYDVLGREVAVLANTTQPMGAHEVKLAESGLAAGVYVVRLEAGGETLVRRVTLVR